MGTNAKSETSLKYLSQLDKELSLKLSLSATNESPLGKYRPHMKGLEYSCHGVFWICGSIITLWFTDDPVKEGFLFNLILALFLDIIFVAIAKACIARKRPENNVKEDMFMTWSIDKMSCPSGHTSRAVLLALIFINSTPSMFILHVLLLAWCFCTCASRVLLGRHHIGDVVVGVILGYFEYCVMDFIWAGPETSKWYLDFFKENSVIDDL